MIIAWFSCGVTSAVACKIALSLYEDVRMDDGFSDRLDKRRIEDMGNAVILLIAQYLFECIKIFDKQNKKSKL